jgi:hypothetical protein
MFGQVKMVMGVDAFDTAVMDSSTAAPGAKLGGSMASVMEIEGGAGVVMLMFGLRKIDALANAGRLDMEPEIGQQYMKDATSSSRACMKN